MTKLHFIGELQTGYNFSIFADLETGEVWQHRYMTDDEEVSYNDKAIINVTNICNMRDEYHGTNIDKIMKLTEEIVKSDWEFPYLTDYQKELAKKIEI